MLVIAKDIIANLPLNRIVWGWEEGGGLLHILKACWSVCVHGIYVVSDALRR